MHAEERRQAILDFLQRSARPVSAGALAERFSVSRQIIVGDVALLRAAGAEVLGVISIFTYGMATGRQRLAEAGVKCVSLTDLDTIAQVGVQQGYITQGDVARLLAFRDDPSDENWIRKGE